jgi:beta-galactosidase
VDNRTNYQERATGTPFEWNANDFNPTSVASIATSGCMSLEKSTRPFLFTMGSKARVSMSMPENFNIAEKTADLTVESDVHNGSGERATVCLSVVVIDHVGQIRAQFEGYPVDMVDGEKSV